MHYEINVSKAGQHYFATAERSIATCYKAKQLYLKLKAAFPEDQGYRINVRMWMSKLTEVDVSEWGREEG